MQHYKFRVLIDNTNNEEVFRDITIPASASFEDFYNIIIKAFYFNGDQMASFYASNNTWDKGQEISLMNMQDSNSIDTPLTMNQTPLNNLIESSDQKFILVYDFLKMWCFLIELIDIFENESNNAEIIISIGISPKEDSREIEFGDIITDDNADLGSEFDDIFSEFDDEDDFGGFENIDDLDI